MPSARSDDRGLRAAAVARRFRAHRRAAGAVRRGARRGCTITTPPRPSSRPTRSTRAACTASRVTIRATATTISTSRSIATQYLRLRPRPAQAAEARAQRVRSDAAAGSPVFRGLFADRGTGGSAAKIRCATVRSNRSACATRAPGIAPYAVVQLRKENAAGTAYNLVGFQTRLTWPAQTRSVRETSRTRAMPNGCASASCTATRSSTRRGCSTPDLRLRGSTAHLVSPDRSPAPKATSKRRPAA